MPSIKSNGYCVASRSKTRSWRDTTPELSKRDSELAQREQEIVQLRQQVAGLTASAPA